MLPGLAGQCHLVLTTRTPVLRIVVQTFYFVSGGRCGDDVEDPTGDPAQAPAFPAAEVSRLWGAARAWGRVRDLPGVRIFALRGVEGPRTGSGVPRPTPKIKRNSGDTPTPGMGLRPLHLRFAGAQSRRIKVDRLRSRVPAPPHPTPNKEEVRGTPPNPRYGPAAPSLALCPCKLNQERL